MALNCDVILKSFDPERAFNHQHFLNVWRQCSLISVNKISDAARKKLFEKLA